MLDLVRGVEKKMDTPYILDTPNIASLPRLEEALYLVMVRWRAATPRVGPQLW